jgi:hypothetical protein
VCRNNDPVVVIQNLPQLKSASALCVLFPRLCPSGYKPPANSPAHSRGASLDQIWGKVAGPLPRKESDRLDRLSISPTLYYHAQQDLAVVPLPQLSLPPPKVNASRGRQNLGRVCFGQIVFASYMASFKVFCLHEGRSSSSPHPPVTPEEMEF